MKSLFLLFILALLSPNDSQATVITRAGCNSSFEIQPQKLDGISGWGTRLVPATEFQNNDWYQQNMKIVMNSDSSTITPYWFARGHSLRGRFDDAMSYWKLLFSSTILQDKTKLGIVSGDIHHHLVPLEFRNSGTEANNYFYEIAGYAFQKRTGKPAKRPQMLFFGSPSKGLYPYGGTFGRSAEISIRYIGKPEDFVHDYLIKDVQTMYFDKIPVAELRRLKAAEEAALEFIRKQVAKESLEIGGIFLEPISVSKGLHFFRPEFLLELRALADELDVPIMADEVFTGGGRTGEFWGFQNYKGFCPDLLSFGKGLELKGVGWMQRQPIQANGRNGSLIWDFPRFDPYKNNDPSKWTYENVRLDNTSVASAPDVLRAIVVMETIFNNNLLSSVKLNGALIKEKAQQRARSLGIPENSIQGIGMVFHFSTYTDQLFPPHSIQNYEGRVTPYITTELRDWPSY